jgi:hypothetical protein
MRWQREKSTRNRARRENDISDGGIKIHQARLKTQIASDGHLCI